MNRERRRLEMGPIFAVRSLLHCTTMILYQKFGVCFRKAVPDAEAYSLSFILI